MRLPQLREIKLHTTAETQRRLSLRLFWLLMIKFSEGFIIQGTHLSHKQGGTRITFKWSG